MHTVGIPSKIDCVTVRIASVESSDVFLCYRCCRVFQIETRWQSVSFPPHRRVFAPCARIHTGADSRSAGSWAACIRAPRDEAGRESLDAEAFGRGRCCELSLVVSCLSGILTGTVRGGACVSRVRNLRSKFRVLGFPTPTAALVSSGVILLSPRRVSILV